MRDGNENSGVDKRVFEPRRLTEGKVSECGSKGRRNAQVWWPWVAERAELVCVSRGRCEHQQNAGAGLIFL